MSTVADARYTGHDRSFATHAPSGTIYNFTVVPGDRGHDLEWTEIEDIEDARWLEDHNAIEVEYRPLGLIQAAASDAAASVKEWSYDTKQSLVKQLGDRIDVNGNSKQEEMDDALQDLIDDLENGGEL